MLDDKIITFIVLAETGNYTKTAKKLNITQPAVTQHIKKLEEYYGCRLVNKEGKNFFLTPEGKILYDYTKVKQVNEKRLESLLRKSEYNIRCGATLSMADYYLDDHIGAYLKKGNKINIFVANTENLIKGMKSGDLDCAFVEGYFDKNIFEYYEFIEEDFVMIVGKDHPLCKKDEITLDDVEKYPLLLREFGSGTRAVLENALHDIERGIEDFESISEIGSFMLIKKILMKTESVTFVYKGVAVDEIENGELVNLSIKDFKVSKKMHFIFLKDSYLKDTCRNFFRRLI